MIQQTIQICRQAGNKILGIYENANFDEITNYKADTSPLTLADQQSHKVINAGLSNLTPDIPVLSEEGQDITFEERKHWDKFWLVDPLDGTKEFIKKNGEFTINIALVKNNYPVLGVIYAPAHDLFYYAVDGIAYKRVGKSSPKQIQLQPKRPEEIKVGVGSRSHAAPEEEEVLHKLGVTEKISMGSAFKFTLVAEGKADVYYRHNPTMEWDTAAGQALVESAGGRILTKNNKRFSYNKQSLVNPSFICLGQIDPIPNFF